ncbi:MAG: hypothetical protein MPW17_23050 (plasmid) [Candidatus Manganitrophus sp.]|nr:MAG: hypothetical protein MPW17_23050 [Candidatus Manganitrophus sp.]
MWIKQTALLFTLVYLFSTGLIMVRAEGHALSHEEHTEDHAEQHASFICTWMCAASTFVHTPGQTLDGQSTPSFESPIAKLEAPPGRNPSPPGPSGLLLLSIPKLFRFRSSSNHSFGRAAEVTACTSVCGAVLLGAIRNH